ncbi:transposable element tc3 transposase [Blumeria hordei DH14]|uniref:Transposable element tc3 transposase n=1 Tax=Blumeria graminis f. sp. hordei (strain DH14) TaxID=546991 RepID=N1JEP2_BLUG1|nr:transposable element tc3 transposase [Blumeria hordei DH14]
MSVMFGLLQKLSEVCSTSISIRETETKPQFKRVSCREPRRNGGPKRPQHSVSPFPTVIQREPNKRGYQRHVTDTKPPASHKTIKTRREWAEAHLNWTYEDWTSALWTDEIWVEDGRNFLYYTDCVAEKSKRVGRMFWGCFAGPEKGPCLFREKEWGSINSQKYCEKIVPLIDGMVSMRPWLSVMQDNASAHAIARTMEDMSQSITV